MDYLIYNLTGYKTHNHLENCCNIILKVFIEIIKVMK